MPGARIAVLHHPEYGFTLSREDGRFDLAINGGGTVSLTYARQGYLPAQRKVLADSLGHGHAPDVALIPLDPNVTTVMLAHEGYQTARGSANADDDGTRQMTLLFPPQLRATIRRADGSTEELASLAFRATEYTVGENGPLAMPADLPATTVYTFAAELSADEALDRGVKVAGKDVQFDEPVSFYVENFLHWPIGTPVPVGYFDNDAAQWAAEPSGVVLEIVDVLGGVAQVDTDGDTLADTPDVLAPLGITDGELGELGKLYVAGTELWRTRMSHLSSHDWNQPYSPPSGARGTLASVQAEHCEDQDCTKKGSIIECTNQILREEIALPGTGLSLTYESDRVPGRVANRTVVIPLTDAEPPASMQRVLVEIYVAGQAIFREFDANSLLRDGEVFNPNQKLTFTWDGKDAYGRPMSGRVHGAVRIGYEFPVMFGSSASFGGPARQENGQILELSEAREAYVFWHTELVTFDAWDDRGVGLGGWRLSQHHQFDPEGGVLHYGYGGRRSVQGATLQPQFIAQRGLGEIALGPDGSVYAVTPFETIAYRYDRDGNESLFAGGGNLPPVEVQAKQALLPAMKSVAVAADGTVYLGGDRKIFRVTPDGVLTTVAGGDAPSKGCGQAPSVGPANTAIVEPYSLAVHGDGRLFIASRGCGLLTLTPDGQIQDAGWMEIPDQPESLAIDREGAVFVLTSRLRVFKLSPNGSWSLAAGDEIFDNPNCWAYSVSSPATGQFGPSSKACLRNAKSIAVDPSGTPYVGMTESGPGLWRFKNGFASVAVPGLSFTSRPAFLPSGEFYYAGSPTGSLVKMAAALPGLTWAQGAIASDDGAMLYITDRDGKQLETQSALSGAVLQRFEYDPKGRLASITDAASNVIAITRKDEDSAAIVGPDGHETTLEMDATGYLAKLTLPNGDVYQLNHDQKGLLTRLVDRRGGTHSFKYDAAGRLIGDADASEANQTLERQAGVVDDMVASTHKVVHESPEGLKTDYVTDVLRSDSVRRSATAPDGTVSSSTRDRLGGETRTSPDGSVVSRVLSPDPRWSTQAPYVSELTIKTPLGLVANATLQRSATLKDPKNRQSLKTLTDTRTLNGRVSTRSYDAATGVWKLTSAAGRTANVTVDTYGRPTQFSVPGLEALLYHYDARGRIDAISQGTGEALRKTTFTYGADGFVSKLTDALARDLAFTRDANGRVIQLALPGERSAALGYDANDNLTSLTPPDRPPHELQYSSTDTLQSQTPPAVAGVDAPATNYSRNLDGDIVGITRPGGTQVTFQYDQGGRPHYIALPSTNGLAEEAIAIAYWPSGQLAGVAHSAGVEVTLEYDGPLVTSESLTGVAATAVVLSRSYDADFRMIAESVNGAETVAFSYDADSLLTKSGSLTLTRDAASGVVTATTLGGVTDEWSYDAFGAPATYQAQIDTSILFKTAFFRDKLGRITKKVETIDGVAKTYEYAYDIAGRLATVTQDEQERSRYSYDSNGNRLSAAVAQVPLANATYDDQDRLLTHGSAEFSYSADGELQAKTNGASTTQYVYDSQGNLRAVALPNGHDVEYLVDALGRRVGKKLDGSLVLGFVYGSQLAPAAELDETGAVRSRFVYGTRVNVPEYMVRDGVSYRIITDHLGSPRLVVNSTTGAIAQRIDYDDWGVVLNDTNPGFQPFGFAGGLYDTDTKLTRFGARDYDASVGRWTTKDPLGFSSGGMNVYAYVSADPVNWVDPSGLVRKRDLVTSLVGMGSSAFGLWATGAMILSTGGVLGVSGGGTLAVKFGYDLMANTLNAWAALHDWEDPSTGSFLQDVASRDWPCSKNAVRVAKMLDLSLGLAMGSESESLVEGTLGAYEASVSFWESVVDVLEEASDAI